MTVIVFLKDGPLVIVENIRDIESDEYEVALKERQLANTPKWHPSQVAKIELVDFP